jgi:hypothetical protein
MIIPGKPDPLDIDALDMRTVVLCKGARFTGPDRKVVCDAKYLF